MIYQPSADRRRSVYRCYDADDMLLYVGCTGQSVEQRLRQHAARGAAWVPLVKRVTVEEQPTPSEGHAAEFAAIRQERPIYNIVRPGQGKGGGRPRKA
jgi:predicted GIY-YIG superfamily endonuclease